MLETKVKGCNAHKLNLEVNEFIGKRMRDKRDEDADDQGIPFVTVLRRQLVTKFDKSAIIR